MDPQDAAYDSTPPERFVVEVFSEIPAGVMRERWEDVNAILRLSMLTGLAMPLDSTLNLLLDLAMEIAPYERAMVYCWDEANGEIEVAATRNMEEAAGAGFAHGNILNYWAAKYARPLLVTSGHNVQADALLGTAHASSALVMPLMVNNRVGGTMQLFTSAQAFTRVDAQLLWILSLVAENQLTRESANEGLI